MSSKMVLDALGYKPAEQNSFGTPVQNLTELKSIASINCVDKQIRLVEDEGFLYHYDAQSTIADDAKKTIQPIDGVATGRWIVMAAMMTTSSHGALLNLLNDDHTQYVHIDVARSIAAQHTFNPATARAAFVLGANAQGQKIVGLNVDQLDGLDSTDFVQRASAGTITVAHTINPTVAGAPFILGANAQGQKVIGLNADTLDGIDSTSFVQKSAVATITVAHTFNPATASAPFILGANAQGQKVIGLNADTVDGLDSTAFVQRTTAGTITVAHTFNPTAVGAPFALGANAQGQKVIGLNADQLDGLDSTSFIQTNRIGVTGGVMAYDANVSNITNVATVVQTTTLNGTEPTTIRVDATNSDIVINLPLAKNTIGKQYWFKRVDTSSYKVTINTSADVGVYDLVNNATSYTQLGRQTDYVVMQAGAAGRWAIFSRSYALLDQVGHITTPPTSTYQLTLADAGFVRCNASTGPIMLTLPAEKISAGYKYMIKKTDTTTNKVTLNCVAGDTIEGSLTYIMTNPSEYVILESCGLTNTWRIFSATPPADKFHTWKTTATDTNHALNQAMTGSIYVDSSAVSGIVVLPSAAEAAGQSYLIKKIDTSVNTVTVQTNSTSDIFDVGNNTTTFVLYFNGDFVKVQSDGVRWRLIERDLHLSYGPPAYVDSGGDLISIPRFHLPFFNSGNGIATGLLLAYGNDSNPRPLHRNYKIKNIRISIGVALTSAITFSLRLNGTTTNFYSCVLPAGQKSILFPDVELMMDGNDNIQVYMQMVGAAKANNPNYIIEYASTN